MATKYSTGRTPLSTHGKRPCPISVCTAGTATRIGMEYHLLRDHDLPGRLDDLKAGLDAATGGGG